MNKTSVFVLGLIGSIIGFLVSIFWLLVGDRFIAGFAAGIVQELTQQFTPITNEMLGFGLLIAFFQTGIGIASFIIVLVKTTPAKLDKKIGNSGIWVLILGIITLLINPFFIVASTLLIISGSLAINKARKRKSYASNYKTGSVTKRKNSNVVFVVLGWIFFGISFYFLPLLFGSLGITMGFLTYRSRNKTHGILIMVFSALVLLIQVIVKLYRSSGLFWFEFWFSAFLLFILGFITTLIIMIVSVIKQNGVIKKFIKQTAIMFGLVLLSFIGLIDNVSDSSNESASQESQFFNGKEVNGVLTDSKKEFLNSERTEQQKEFLDYYKDYTFQKFAGDFYELKDKEPLFTQCLEGEKVTWSGTVVKGGVWGSRVAVYGYENGYDGESWNEITDSPTESKVFVADYDYEKNYNLNEGDTVIFEGFLDIRGMKDKNVNLHWRLKQSKLVKKE